MKIYNSFGIKPTNTFVSAGTDYYIPNLDTPEKAERAYKAFEKSYGKTEDEIKDIIHCFKMTIKNYFNYNSTHIPNLVHLYLALYDPLIEELKKESPINSVQTFLNEFVVYDKVNDKIGLKMGINDTLFINSGIKIALDTVLSEKAIGSNSNYAVNVLRILNIGVAGLYVNKSGNGNKGWDVRACLVDEDYSGYVHLSMAYTKELIEDGQNIIYCGDKLTQMMLIPVFHTQYEEISEEEYNDIMNWSHRGDSGFGSSDVKH